jgi:integrase
MGNVRAAVRRAMAAPRSPAAEKMRRHRDRAARVDGGPELPLKVVQARLGHASIQMTADTCRSTRHA